MKAPGCQLAPIGRWAAGSLHGAQGAPQGLDVARRHGREGLLMRSPALLGHVASAVTALAAQTSKKRKEEKRREEKRNDLKLSNIRIIILEIY